MAEVVAPIDVTHTSEWTALRDHHERLQTREFSLKQCFATDPQLSLIHI